MGILHRQRQCLEARALIDCSGRASFYDTPRPLSPVRTGLLIGPFGLFGVFRLADMSQVRRPKVRAARPREPLGLGAPPIRDLGMVAGGQHLRDRTPLPQLRPGILRVFEKALGEAFLLARRLLAHDPRQEPDAGVQQDESRDLPAREHVVADRDLLELATLDHTLVDALEAAAEDDGAGPFGQRFDLGLRERNSTWAHHQARARIARGGNSVDGAPEHVGAHDHAGPAAGRRIIDGAMLVGCVRADIDGIERPEPGRKRPARQARTERPRKHVREDGEDGRAPHDQVPAGIKKWMTRAKSLHIELRFRSKYLFGRMILPEKSATFRNHALALFRSFAHRGFEVASGGATMIRPPAMSMLGTNASVNGSMMVVPPAGGRNSRISPAPKSCTATTVPISVPSAVTADSPIRSA